MKEKSLFIVIIVMMFLILFSGCTATDSAPIEGQTTTAAIPNQEQPVISEPLIVKSGDIPEDITITYDAKPVNENSAVLIYYTLDSTKADSYTNQDGWKITVTAFAYNTKNAPANFNPKNIRDIMNSGIPYESRSIHVYPKNVYPDKIEISNSPTGQTIDLNNPYNYGILFTLY
ncbi:MAG: hypothetical protein PHV39_02940 [Methanomicrobium sp.]|nr:hypothetical protein [Methanomicrobium sp.]